MTGLSIRQDLTPQERLEKYADRLDALEMTLQALVARIEMSDKAVTVLHADVLDMLKRIRVRAAELAARYQLPAAAEGEIRKAIKKAVLEQWRIRDLHDLPRRDLEAAGIFIGSYASFVLIRKLRGKHGESKTIL